MSSKLTTLRMSLLHWMNIVSPLLRLNSCALISNKDKEPAWRQELSKSSVAKRHGNGSSRQRQISLTSLPGLHAAESHVSDFCNSHSSLVYDIVNVYMIQATSSQSLCWDKGKPVNERNVAIFIILNTENAARQHS